MATAEQLKFLETEPDVDGGTRFLASAYSELATERRSGMGMGPIPWSSMIDWCRYHGLDRDVSDHLVHVIARVDGIIRRRDLAKMQVESQKRNAPRGRR